MKKGQPVGVRFDNDVRDALERAAVDDDRSLSSYVNKVMREHFGLARPSTEKAGSKKRK